MRENYKRRTGLNYFTGLLKDGTDYYVLRSGVPVYEFNEVWIEVDDKLHTVFTKEKFDSMFVHAPDNAIAQKVAEEHGNNAVRGVFEQDIPFPDDGKRPELVEYEQKYTLIRELSAAS